MWKVSAQRAAVEGEKERRARCGNAGRTEGRGEAKTRTTAPFEEDGERWMGSEGKGCGKREEGGGKDGQMRKDKHDEEDGMV